MKYADFENLMSTPRLNRYLGAAGNDKRKAMTLYRKNLKLSQELFGVVSYFEIALRNGINDHYLNTLGADWLRNSAQPGGVFDNNRNASTRDIINGTINTLRGNYSHPKLVSDLNFGFWRYMFSKNQYRACGQTLISIFPNRPSSTPQVQYNARYIFNELKRINDLRNRIAHHDQICFQTGAAVIDTTYAQNRYNKTIRLLQWMDINPSQFLYGVDRVQKTIIEINAL